MPLCLFDVRIWAYYSLQFLTAEAVFETSFTAYHPPCNFKTQNFSQNYRKVFIFCGTTVSYFSYFRYFSYISYFSYLSYTSYVIDQNQQNPLPQSWNLSKHALLFFIPKWDETSQSDKKWQHYVFFLLEIRAKKDYSGWI